MYRYHLFDFFVRHYSAEFFKSVLDVAVREKARVVCVELLEDCMQTLVCQKLLEVDSSG